MNSPTSSVGGSSQPSLSHDALSTPTLPRDGQAKSLIAVLAAVALAIFLAVHFDRGGERAEDADAWVSPPGALGPTLSETDPSYFLLNALLVPALDRDAQPLRWADPRPPAGCGPRTTVSVDGHPLVPGALVPIVPFELTWDARACHPFGPHGPRFEGAVRFTVFREDWGWSAIVESAGLRIAMHDRTVPVTRNWATMPQWIDPIEHPALEANGD